MITLLTQETLIPKVQDILSTFPEWKQKAEIQPLSTSRETTNKLTINEKGIHWPLFWNDHLPPYLVATQKLSDKNLLALIFFLSGEAEKALEVLPEESPLKQELKSIYLLLNYAEIPSDILNDLQGKAKRKGLQGFTARHNLAVLKHYGKFSHNPTAREEALNLYQQAIEVAPNPEWKAFSCKQQAILLMDLGLTDEAEKRIRETIDIALTEDARMALKSLLSDALIKKLVIPYDELLIMELKSLVQDTLEYEKKKGNLIGMAQAYAHAAYIALIAKNYTEALHYINSALKNFKQADNEILLADALMRKGEILYTWAQSGNPQFYKAAAESYQEALKVFSREFAPATFAQIHHQLGLIYTDFPVEDKKRGIMAGMAQNSFKLALAHFTKDKYPYEYAAICNHFGNALCKFPPSIHSDNFQKALYYYKEALEIRTPEYPYERAITLLNYIQACWHLRNEKQNGQHLWSDMKRKAEEVLELVSDETLRAEAQKHLRDLEEWKKALKK